MEKQKGEKEGCENVMLLQKSVKKLHFGSWEEKDVAAKEIERLAKEYEKVRELATELGVLRVLVSMALSDVASRRRVALKALIHLSNGNHKNKALIVEAGLLCKLPKKIDLEDESIREFADLLSSLSSLGNIQFPHSSLDFLQFLIDILKSCPSFDTKESCLVAMCNISTVLENAGPLISNGVVPILLELCSEKGTSEKALTILGNLGVTLMGKKALENSSIVPKCLIEILSWEDEPKCQELSTNILIILAHKNSTQRSKMVQSGIVPVLLQVALLGSSSAQKRARKLLRWFRDESQIEMGPHLGPQSSRIAYVTLKNQRDTEEGRRTMKSLVRESLHRNMEIITKRVNAGEDSSNGLKSLVTSTSSKSLPN
ncbi:hypothetical protein LR48_Vigan01g142600 [Vigna angularis]|uniref:Armadillo repeat-containing domain-containing protein n=1 Tax=Phaseolus angularis TaxID=3914 RepID=A0A0L9TMT2_PHAAN|nr:uncharacterized protein HKW66_Vig0039640 [Vigna angularis]KOM31870.1 hypothetical protein LR48_Vigan01g142600 [Vigna angularis]